MTDLSYGPFISRKQAQAQGLKHYYTGKPCKNGHLDIRLVAKAVCCTCKKEQGKRNYERNPDRHVINAARWAQENVQKKRDIRRRWRENHPDRYQANVLKNRARKIVRTRAWEKLNPQACTERSARRRARKRQATVPLTAEQRKQIINIYALRDTLTANTGVVHHVDHYIPLCKGGLHVPENLWVITAKANRSKSGKMPKVG